MRQQDKFSEIESIPKIGEPGGSIKYLELSKLMSRLKSESLTSMDYQYIEHWLVDELKVIYHLIKLYWVVWQPK